MVQVSEHLYLIQLPRRKQGYDVLAKTNINLESAKKLAETTERVWAAIQARDVESWGKATTEDFNAQVEMFPAMLSEEMQSAIDKYRDQVCGWKVTGCGGGGYLFLISKTPIETAIKVTPCHLDN